MGWKQAIALTIAVPTFILAIGYAFRSPPNLLEQFTPAQRAAVTYSEAVRATDGPLNAFHEAWSAAHSEPDPDRFVQALKDQVVPALAAVVEVVSSVEAGDDALRAIHAPLVAAYRQTSDAVSVFVETSVDDNRKESMDQLVAELMALTVADAAYRKALKSHYRSHRIQWEEPEASQPPDRAAEEQLP